MATWRDHILKEFTPKVSRLTIVADPDGLLLEEGILEGIRNRAFELIPFEDHIAFRYSYESKYRSHWDRGEQTDLVVVLRSTEGDLSSLPYDLLQAGRKLSFSLGEIFPSLSYPVVAALDRADLDALYDAQIRHSPGQLGDNATKEFALRHVFEIAPELINQPSDLLRVLLRRHYRRQRVPAMLDEGFIQLLRQRSVFDEWPLETLVTDREAFFAFLQERWPIFLGREAGQGRLPHEKLRRYGLTIPGPLDLPFGHDDVRVYIDNLFADGLLHPVAYTDAESLTKSWSAIGLQTTAVQDQLRRVEKLLESIEASIPNSSARHLDWLQFARRWAELIVLTRDPARDDLSEVTDRAQGLQIKVDETFTSWLLKRYAGLINLPPVPPAMLHHLPRFLARQTGEDRSAKVALIVMDGLAIDQWLVVRSALSVREPTLRFREQALFAWAPTLTAVSRQAVFAGRAPALFPDNLLTTDREHSLWDRFWADHGFKPDEIVYQKGLGDGDLRELSEELSHPKVRVAGLVVDKVDKIMHGMELGTAGMHNQVRQWAESPYLASLCDALLSRGFRIWLTSDHGNIEARGCGRPSEGSVAELRGERARVYSDVVLRRTVNERFPEALAWDPIGLPEDYLSLIAPARTAFIPETKRAVCHGGISIEELIVPLIQIERRRL